MQGFAQKNAALLLLAASVLLASCQDPYLGIGDLDQSRALHVDAQGRTNVIARGSILGIDVSRPPVYTDEATELTLEIRANDGTIMHRETRELQDATYPLALSISSTAKLPPGRWTLSWSASRGSRTIERNDLVFFVFDHLPAVESISVLPLSVESSAKALAMLSVRDPYHPQTLVRWSLGDRVIATRAMADQGRVVVFDTPALAGTYALRAELFPPEALGYILPGDSSALSARATVVTGDRPVSSAKARWLAPRALHAQAYLLDGSLRSWTRGSTQTLNASVADGWALLGNHLGYRVGKGQSLGAPGSFLWKDDLPLPQVWKFLLDPWGDSAPSPVSIYRVPGADGSAILDLRLVNPAQPTLELELRAQGVAVVRSLALPDELAQWRSPLLIGLSLHRGPTMLIPTILINQRPYTLEGLVLDPRIPPVALRPGTPELGRGEGALGLLAFSHGPGEYLVLDPSLITATSWPLARIPVKPGANFLDLVPVSQAESLRFVIPATVPEGSQRFTISLYDVEGNRFLERVLEYNGFAAETPLVLDAQVSGLGVKIVVAGQEQVFQAPKEAAWVQVRYQGFSDLSFQVKDYTVYPGP